MESMCAGIKHRFPKKETPEVSAPGVSSIWCPPFRDDPRTGPETAAANPDGTSSAFPNPKHGLAAMSRSGWPLEAARKVFHQLFCCIYPLLLMESRFGIVFADFEIRDQMMQIAFQQK
jgi:hypothetical protein